MYPLDPTHHCIRWVYPLGHREQVERDFATAVFDLDARVGMVMDTIKTR
jgi:hypothetical protein